jgi:two-component system, response regulator PdtaR
MSVPRKIFIAEDDVFASEQLKDLLSGMNYIVTGIGFDKESSVAILERDRPDIAILDIKMDGTYQGFEIAEHINKHYGIPFIFLTSYSDRATVDTAMKYSPIAYLLKPVSAGIMFSTLEIVKSRL